MQEITTLQPPVLNEEHTPKKNWVKPQATIIMVSNNGSPGSDGAISTGS